MCYSLHTLKIRLFKGSTETKKAALQHTFECRTFIRSFHISNGGYLSLSMEPKFFSPFYVSAAHIHAVVQCLSSLPHLDTCEQYFSSECCSNCMLL